MTLEQAARDQAIRRRMNSAPAPEGKPTVTIYVRKGEWEGERTISINPIPAEADPLELLDVGFAIDGNSATLSVENTRDYVTWADPEGGVGSIKVVERASLDDPRWSLTVSVNVVERTIVAWLKKLGYTPKFG